MASGVVEVLHQLLGVLCDRDGAVSPQALSNLFSHINGNLHEEAMCHTPLTSVDDLSSVAEGIACSLGVDLPEAVHLMVKAYLAMECTSEVPSPATLSTVLGTEWDEV
eukprot:Sspe_Gene.79870::Locus_50191_Transcript_1_1_Confidence_1.000_Length_377::g.79870::m.79870